jgi:hypothetical protein
MKNSNLTTGAICLVIMFMNSGCFEKAKQSFPIDSVVDVTLENEHCHIIDIDQIDYEKSLALSSLFNGVKTVILESTDKSIVGRINSLQTHKDMIIILDKVVSKAVFVFDKSGNFMHRIGNRGRGPGEYAEVSDFTIDSKNEIIYVLDNRSQSINVYNLITGDFITAIRFQGDIVRSFHIQFVDDRLYSDAYFWSKSDDIFLLREIDISSGSQLKCWLKTIDYNKNSSDLYFSGSGVFYSRNSNKPKFLQMFMDTVITVAQNGITPYLAIKSKKLLTQKDIENAKGNTIDEKRNAFLTMDKIYQIENFIEFGNKVCFDFRHQNMISFVVYDTDSHETIITKRLINDFIYSEQTKDVLATSFCHADNDGVYSYIHPFQMERFVESAKRNQLNENLDKINSIKSLDDNANPILFIYEFR